MKTVSFGAIFILLTLNLSFEVQLLECTDKRDKRRECAVDGQVFQECRTCPATCKNPHIICIQQCQPGCGCPPGQLIDEENNRCVEREQCQMTGTEPGKYCTCTLADNAFMEITSYLWQLEKTHIYHLGLVLGLSQHRMKDLKDSYTFLDDVISSWLRQEDQVQCVGEPSWKTLVEALTHERVEQNGIACKIAKDKGLEAIATGSALHPTLTPMLPLFSLLCFSIFVSILCQLSVFNLFHVMFVF